MNWSRIQAILSKDIQELAANRMAVLPMIIVPLLICILMPAAVLVLGLSLDIGVVSGMEQMKRIIPQYPVPADFTEPLEQVLFIFLNYTFIPLFLLVPLMAATIIIVYAVAFGLLLLAAGLLLLARMTPRFSREAIIRTL